MRRARAPAPRRRERSALRCPRGAERQEGRTGLARSPSSLSLSMPLSIWYAAINDALHMHSPPSRSAGGRPVGRGEVEGRIVGAAWTRRSISATGRVWTRARTCRISQLSGRPEAAIQAFGAGSVRANHVKLAVLIGSLLAATLATVVLRI